ncbi:hypothetical protein GCM10027614_81150 [Micromonospora vulcania]
MNPAAGLQTGGATVAPQRQGLAVELDGRLAGAALGLGDQAPESQQVERLPVDAQPVLGAVADQHRAAFPGRQTRLEAPPENPDVPVHHVVRAGWRVGLPQQVDEFGDADRASGTDEQHRQDQSLLPGAQVDLGLAAPGPHRAEDGEESTLVIVMRSMGAGLPRSP